jgi:hypothetical protein
VGGKVGSVEKRTGQKAGIQTGKLEDALRGRQNGGDLVKSQQVGRVDQMR